MNLFVVEALRWTDDDQRVLDELVQRGRPDHPGASTRSTRCSRRSGCCRSSRSCGRRATFAEIVPLSALKGSNLEELPATDRALPAASRRRTFPPTRSPIAATQFQAAEIVREKLTLRLRQELPYGLTVGIEQFKEEDGRLLVNAVIWVERTGQKAIVIGHGGEQLKEVGRSARTRNERAVQAPGAPGAVGEGEGELVGQRDCAAPAGLRDVTSERRAGASSCSRPTCCITVRIATPAAFSSCSRATTVACRCSPAARAARARQAASLTSILQPFNRLLVSWSGRGEAGQLTAAEFDGAVSTLPPDRLVSGFYLNELLLKLFARHDSHPDVFALYARDARRAQGRCGRRCARCGCSRSDCWMRSATGWHWSAMSTPIGRSMPRRVYHYRLEQGAMRIDGVAEGVDVFSGSNAAVRLRARTSPTRRSAPTRACCCVPRWIAAWKAGSCAPPGDARRLRERMHRSTSCISSPHDSLHLGVNVDHVATLRQARRTTLSGSAVRRADRRAGGRRQHHDSPARGSPAHPGSRCARVPRGAADAAESRDGGDRGDGAHRLRSAAGGLLPRAGDVAPR